MYVRKRNEVKITTRVSIRENHRDDVKFTVNKIRPDCCNCTIVPLMSVAAVESWGCLHKAFHCSFVSYHEHVQPANEHNKKRRKILLSFSMFVLRLVRSFPLRFSDFLSSLLHENIYKVYKKSLGLVEIPVSFSNPIPTSHTNSSLELKSVD